MFVVRMIRCIRADASVCNREAVGQRCDVTNWDSQLALFELGISSFGAIDVVVCSFYIKLMRRRS